MLQLLSSLFVGKRRLQSLVGLAFATFLLVTACTGGSSNQPTSNAGESATSTTASAGSQDTLVWARYGDADSLDPHRTTTTLSWQIFDQLYDTLLAFNDKGEIVPNLAKEWKISPDGKEVRFVLNSGITCHDGSSFDANDVKYTAERAIDTQNPSVTKGAWGPISAVEVVGPQTVNFKFATPFGAFASFMADPFASMLCDSNKDLGTEFGVTKAIGTGPWKLVSWTKGFAIK